MSAINVCDERYASCMKQNEPVVSSLPSTPLDGLVIKGKKCARVIDGFMCGKDFYELKDGGRTLVYNSGKRSSQSIAKRHTPKSKVLISKKVEDARDTKANFEACYNAYIRNMNSDTAAETCEKKSKTFNYTTSNFDACYNAYIRNMNSHTAAETCEKKSKTFNYTTSNFDDCYSVYSRNMNSHTAAETCEAKINAGLYNFYAGK